MPPLEVNYQGPEDLGPSLRMLAESLFLNVLLKTQSASNGTVTISLLNLGRSSVRKFYLEYKLGALPTAYRFLARLHKGTEEATTERRVAAQLHFYATDPFPKLIDQDEHSNAVVYRYTDDECRETMTTLDELVARQLRSTSGMGEVASRVQKLLATCTAAYGHVGEQQGAKTQRDLPLAYFERIAEDLPPALVIDGSNLLDAGDLPFPKEMRPTGAAIVLDPGDDYGNVRGVRNVSATEFVRWVEEWHTGEVREWQMATFECHAVLPYGTANSDTLLVLRGEEDEVWVTLPTPIFNRQQITPGIRVVVGSRGLLPAVRPIRAVLRDKGLDDAHYHGRRNVWQAFDDLQSDHHHLALASRHTDLHAGNVLLTEAGEHLRVIDLGDAGKDLLLADAARLEISLWYEVGSALPQDETTIRSLLHNLDSGLDAVGNLATTGLYRILRAIRAGVREGLRPHEPSRADETAAYACQVLFWLRYTAHPSARTVSVAFRTVAQYWLKRLDRMASDVTTAARGAGEMSTGTSEHTLAELWQTALKVEFSPGNWHTPEAMQGFLNNLLRQKPELEKKRLSDLQHKVFRRLNDPAVSLLNDPRHLILAGPTSCGKTTVAELFLCRTALGSVNRRALYIAPTRSLAQQKHRDLLALFHEFTLEDEPTHGETWAERFILLSTGEDLAADFRIAHNDYRIACMVYEKANILFSRNPGFLNGLGCVVVDEFHMVSDLQRGPLLELALGKAVSRRNDTKAEGVPRVIAISTEGTSFAEVGEFLSVPQEGPNPAGGTVPAEVITSDVRPVKTEHVLILPGRHKTSYALVAFLTFERGFERTLGTQQLRDTMHKITGAKDAHKPLAVSHVKNSMDDRLLELLKKLTNDHSARGQEGYRVLVFVPTKRDTERLARKVKDLRGGSKKDNPAFAAAGAKYKELLSAAGRKSDEDQDILATLEDCAGSMVFFHHSDVSQDVRRVIEDIAARPPERGEVHVLFATETLKFGVNLAIKDVVLHGYKFYKSPRQESDELSIEDKREPLDQCSYHNMVGRAGRLGMFSGKTVSTVYVLVPDGDDAYEAIVKRYYAGVVAPVSTLFTKDDIQAVRRHGGRRQVGENRDLGAIDLTPPFVVAVLDALRHRCLQKGASFSRSHFGECDEIDLLDFLNTNTFFACTRLPRSDDGQTEQERVERRQFRTVYEEALKAVLKDLSSPELELVKHREANKRHYYTITERGEAIIDSGTEIATIVPMLTLANQMFRAWGERPKEGPDPSAFPVELLLLVVLAQKEVGREYLWKMPELGAHERVQWEEETAALNREDVLQATIDALERIGVRDDGAFAGRLRELLERWEAEHAVNLPEKYKFGRVDSILRMFAAMVKWVNGDDYNTDIRGQIEKGQAFSGVTEKFTSFISLKNQLAWKSRCLANMLDASKLGVVIDERQLFQLENRVRNGCATEAIPLFQRTSDLKRPQLRDFVKHGYTAETILQAGGKITIRKIPEHTLVKLRKGLENFAKDKLAELATIWTARTPREEDDEQRVIQELWKNVSRQLYPLCVTAYPTVPTPQVALPVHPAGVDAAVRAAMEGVTHLWQEGDGSEPRRSGTPRLPADQEIAEEVREVRVRVLENTVGFELLLKNIPEGKESAVQFAAVQFTEQGEVLDGPPEAPAQAQPFADWLKRTQAGERLCVIAFPWWPADTRALEAAVRQVAARGKPLRVKLVSVAAFLLWITLAKRKMASVNVLHDLILGGSEANGVSKLTTEDILHAPTQLKDLPKLREAILSYPFS